MQMCFTICISKCENAYKSRKLTLMPKMILTQSTHFQSLYPYFGVVKNKEKNVYKGVIH